MATVNLKELYNTKAFTDLTIVAGDGSTSFSVHKIVLCSAPGLKELVEGNGDIHLQLPEPAVVVERLLQWLYTVPWAGMRVDLEGGLGELKDLAEAADKYRMPKLRENILAVIRNQVIPRLATPQLALNAAVGLCDEGFKGVVQQMAMGRALDLLTIAPAPQSWTAAVVVPPPPPSQPNKRKLSTGTTTQDANNETARVTKRAKKEAAAPPPPPPVVKKRGPGRPSTKSVVREPPAPPELHCICQTTEHDQLLVMCDDCDKWFHPACIGKSGYDAKTVQQHKAWAMEMDVMKLMGDKAFKCLECDKA
ncbi:hypothetical protein LTR36_002174 [Oleoguttula mirabilis]|uniref:PHD-type domain-containing protein n=1 Tax=Oleoguttula mirabilis TaxID=1507867 RepID=A0AAV9JKN4_9PEZI|nr:hypothetical protein LTR36_002174 [Oleoguttula mirabilis]